MREVRVVIVDPFTESDLKVERIILLIRPDNVFFDGAHNAFSIHRHLSTQIRAF
ncbi:MAG: hypothetical protein WC578_03780 [Candidatus Omnitrophota bacterium]